MPSSPAYTGASWDDLNATLGSKGHKLWAELQPIDGPALLVKAKHLGAFRSGSVFHLTCMDQKGREIGLLGHCPRRPDQEVKYTLL